MKVLNPDIHFSTEKLKIAQIIDTDKFWLEWLENGYNKSDKYWLECMRTKKPYCYGRNDPRSNIQYADSWFKMSHIKISDEIWEKSRSIFKEILKRRGFL